MAKTGDLVIYDWERFTCKPSVCIGFVIDRRIEPGIVEIVWYHKDKKETRQWLSEKLVKVLDSAV